MRVSKYFKISRWTDLSSLERSFAARSSNSIVQAKVLLHLFKSQALARIFEAVGGDSNVFQVVQARLNGFTKEDISRLTCKPSCLLDLFGQLVGNLNSSHKIS